jgi:uncharacterized membrane protein YhaH (DUF805 family)
MNGEVNENARSPTSLTALWLFSGMLSRGRYFIWLGVALLLLVFAFGFAASVMNSTGGGEPFLAIPFFLTFVWLHICIVLARLRDAGRSLWLTLVFILGPVAWFALTIELIETPGGWILLLLGFVIFYIVPGLIRRRDETAAA